MKRVRSEHVARKQERKFDAILQAACDVFVAKGYSAATTRDIAERVNIQPGSLYYYIDSKEAALVEICRRVGRQFARNMAVLLERNDPVDTLIRDGVRAHVLNNRAQLVFHFVFSPHGLPPSVRRELNRMSHAYQGQWEELLERGRRQGYLRADLNAKSAAVALLAMCNGSVEWYQRKAASVVADIAGEFADFFLRGVLPERAPRAAAEVRR